MLATLMKIIRAVRVPETGALVVRAGAGGYAPEEDITTITSSY